jgi:hypothetical protein
MEQTQLSHQEWRNLILVEPKGKDRSRYYSAICLIGYDVDILNTDTSARAFAAEAVEKVAAHIKIAHSDAVM